MTIDIDKLDELQQVENEGRGITCVKHIINCLRLEDRHTAEHIYQWDGDKIRSYPFIQQWFYENFGCRGHLDKDCKSSLCIALKEHNDNRRVFNPVFFAHIFFYFSLWQ